MTPSKKNTSRAATSIVSKAKSPADRVLGPVTIILLTPDVLIEDVGEGLSFPPIDLRAEENRHEA